MAILSAASQAFATPFTGTYTFSGTTGSNNPYAYNGTDIANLTEGELGRTNLPVANSAGNYRSSGFALDLSAGTLTGSYDPAKYFEFSLTAASGYTLGMSNITFGLGRSFTGPRSWAWASSVDNFASFAGDYSSLGASGFFSTTVSSTNPAGALYFINDTALTTGTNIVLDLSGTSFQNLSTISFRLYGWNSEATGGTAGLQGPLSFSGSLALAVVPEPSTWVLGAAGIACAGWGAWRRRKRARHAPANVIPARGEQVTITGLPPAVFFTTDLLRPHHPPHPPSTYLNLPPAANTPPPDQPTGTDRKPTAVTPRSCRPQ